MWPLSPESKMGELPLNINIRDPRWDQSTFVGRAKHFFTVTNPLNLLLSDARLKTVQTIVENYRAGIVAPGMTEDELWKAKYEYDSAFHPDTGEKVYLIGRMSAQVPMNMIISGCMLTFHKNIAAVIFWQWVNQSFNAVVNYSNRSGDATVTEKQLATAYLSATTGAVVTAVGLKSLTKHLPSLVSRFIPFTAVAAANCINIPLMRQREMVVGIPVTDEAGYKLGYSTKAAQLGIFQVVTSRIGMLIPPLTPALALGPPASGAGWLLVSVRARICEGEGEVWSDLRLWIWMVVNLWLHPDSLLLSLLQSVVLHSPVLCAFPSEEFHFSEPPGARAQS
uniref:Sidoreflexin n=1 Tax=Sarcophilus harrisii TaxID=9305 RepID=A0A7N4V3K7_SARHA